MENQLKVTDIANFRLLAEKYKAEIQKAGINNDSNTNKKFLEQCSESVSDQLKIMDNCQKMLYKVGYNKDNIDQMIKVKNIFKEGVETMQSVLKSFDIVTSEISEEKQ